MLQIKNTLGGGKPEGLYAWKKCIDYANVHAITLPGYHDNGSASDKMATSYIGNFSSTPTVYSSSNYSIDEDTGMFILTGNIREYTPSSSSSSNYFSIHKQYIMFGTTTGNCMWTGIASECYGWLYWDSNNDYWLLNRYSQTGLAKVIALRAKGSSTTGATNVTLKSSGNIYYSSSVVTDTSGNISLSGTISSLAYSSSNVNIPAGKFFMIDSKSSDLAFFSSLNNSYPTIVSPFYGRVEADSPSYAYIVINKSTVKKIVSFVVSDKETAYPDGGEKGGYWYERVVDGLDLSDVGFTKAESGEITCSSQTSFTVPHSLGVLPKVILLMLTGASKSGRVTILVATRYKNGSSYYYTSKAGSESSGGGGTISDIFDVYYNTSNVNAKATGTDTSVNFQYDDSYNHYFYNGGKYKYLFLG